MKFALLGGGGCFALNCASYLIANGHEVFGIGRSHKPPCFWQAPPEYRYTVAHLVTELDRYIEILDGEKPDVIVNFAAQGEGAASFGAFSPLFYRTNCEALSSLVWSIKDTRFIQIGTSELYGSVEKPSKETDPIIPTSPYAISKAAFDMHLQVMHRIHGMPINIIRPSNCYTPGQQLHRIIPKAIICALTGKKLPLQGGGKARKSYLDASDLSAAVMDVATVGVVGKVYNCGPHNPISIADLVAIIARTCGVAFDDLVDMVPDRVGQDGQYWLDSTELRKDTGWVPFVGLVNGIHKMVEWVKAYPELLTMQTDFVMRP